MEQACPRCGHPGSSAPSPGPCPGGSDSLWAGGCPPEPLRESVWHRGAARIGIDGSCDLFALAGGVEMQQGAGS